MIIKSLEEGGRRVRVRESNEMMRVAEREVTTEAEVGILCLEDGSRTHKLRNVSCL